MTIAVAAGMTGFAPRRALRRRPNPAVPPVV